jgi:serine protease AprX
MRRINIFFCLLFTTLLSAQNNADWREKLDPEVKAAFNSNQNVDILIVLKETADISAAKNFNTKSAKAQYVFSKLRETAQRSQVNVSRILYEHNAFANAFYLVNAISVQKCTPELIEKIGKLPEVASLGTDPWTYFDGFSRSDNFSKVVTSNQQTTDRGTIEWGIEKINAPAVWALGYTGQGITVGGADTGYDWTHPALRSHYRGYNVMDSIANHTYNWHDGIHDISPLNADSLNPCGLNLQSPCDDNSHGTHTAGTMVGDDGQGNQIGVAPGAKWIGCRNMERGWGKPSSYIECFEWFLAPTDLNGANPDIAKAPHVINNSWYCAVSEGCNSDAINELMRTAVINLKASGVVVVISNGNDGSGGQCQTTNNPPAKFKESFGVGATDIDDAITGFSSRGPILDQGNFVVKPNVSAPGANVRSSVPNGNYSNFWGTSMAGPHVVGMVALILSARPDLAGNVEAIEKIVQNTAVFFTDSLQCNGLSEDARPNHSYGWGRIDALAAVNEALTFVIPTTSPFEVAFEARLLENPVNDALIFEIKNLPNEGVLEIFNGEGKLIESQLLKATTLDVHRISGKDMNSGVYFWKINAGNTVVSGKLVKI